MVIYQLLRPLSYLTIDHPSKWKYDWLVPGLLAAISISSLAAISSDINFFGAEGLIALTSSFIQILPGFYIAALAAIATFNRHDIDQYLPAPTPTISIRIGGHQNTINLTRRRFLCMLFAFLTFESISLALVSICAIVLAPHFANQIHSVAALLAKYGFLLGYMLLFWQLLTATLVGLYYLGDKLHEPS